MCENDPGGGVLDGFAEDLPRVSGALGRRPLEEGGDFDDRILSGQQSDFHTFLRHVVQAVAEEVHTIFGRLQSGPKRTDCVVFLDRWMICFMTYKSNSIKLLTRKKIMNVLRNKSMNLEKRSKS